MDITDCDTPLISIPNKLIVSPLHIRDKHISDNHSAKVTYGNLYKEYPEIFDPDYPLEPSPDMIGKMVNIWGEYMEITFFLVIERIKGDQSFFKPFLDSLPEANESLFNLDPNKTIYGQ